MRVCPDFKNVSVLVVGDVMLDRFWSGSTARVSPEAPVPVVKVGHTQDRAGGAGNVAVNVAALAGRATLAGLCGEDDAAKALRRSVEQHGVQWSVTPCSVDTIVKLRVLSRHQQLLRMDFEQNLSDHADDVFLGYVKTLIPQADVVILSDYGKGTLTGVTELIASARALGKRVLVDPKGVDLDRYRGATVLTPNRAEFEAVVGPCADESELVRRGEALRESLDLDALLITRSEQGMTLIERGEPVQHFSAQAREVYDVTGAGDTVISVLGAALGAGESLLGATELANTAAGIVVGKLGTATVNADELNHALAADDHHSPATPGRLLDRPSLLRLVEQARLNGERVVMTNGCFDLLHAGHVAYLEAARALGDRLIVALNDDASVARLKGPERPINPLDSRARVLSGLRSVDWVVPFEEDTPANLIADVLPDVLVKGGDYEVEAIAGHRAVLDAGGRVEILDFVDGHSTSSMISTIKSR
ncbi:bifunctional protein HldE [Luminiphilus syltensis NOR5-1B]|uniref:Bifunctional protein HldE n=1 Tax=Luminiphilus syltensis NOR5-1B TaxID=565045 RepID=B8KQQ0_9GAMM|nr:bifunctional D-glycero-beta-D-manno-heptose-7-phosphate kinase/D-glycero-beta-D-manno-heptose 1-phosphate adenylyltransferase HldE [Luminiphilus syltensis]EED36305.1 bifunctional protein HldE [Luminiphilus syltensis NOR5-1B]